MGFDTGYGSSDRCHCNVARGEPASLRCGAGARQSRPAQATVRAFGSRRFVRHQMNRRFTWFRCTLAIALTCVGTAALAQSGPQPPLPTARLTAGMHVVTAEVADTPHARTVGMMYRESTPPNHGMLFVFEDKGVHCFWMRNTPLPLSIAFIDDDGTISHIADMAPKSDASHCPPRPVRYALEMEKGWFAKKGMKAGSRIAGLPAQPGARR